MSAVDGRPDVLRRLLGPRPRRIAGEACELCAAPIADDHRHVVDITSRSLHCSCRGCALLFEGAVTSGMRTVPDRYLRLEPFVLDLQRWNELQIPVSTVFVMASTPTSATVAFYPSPGGATESELPMDTWEEIVAANPALGEVTPDVEAALIRVADRRRPAAAGAPSDIATRTCFVLPIDRCYELVGQLRLHWRGFDGGQDVRRHLDEFFADLARRSSPVGAVR